MENSNVESQGKKVYESNAAISLYGPKIFFGPKVPLGRVSWTIAEAVGGIRFFTITAGRSDISASNKFSLAIGGRTGFDLAVSCEVHLGGHAGFNILTSAASASRVTFQQPEISTNGVPSVYGQASITFQPSSECRREREAGDPSMSVRQAQGAR